MIFDTCPKNPIYTPGSLQILHFHLFLEKNRILPKMFGNPKNLGRQESQKPADKSQVEQDLDDFNRKRLEKDLLELQRLIDIHFDERQNDENELGGKIFVRFMSDFNNFC